MGILTSSWKRDWKGSPWNLCSHLATPCQHGKAQGGQPPVHRSRIRVAWNGFPRPLSVVPAHKLQSPKHRRCDSLPSPCFSVIWPRWPQPELRFLCWSHLTFGILNPLQKRRWTQNEAHFLLHHQRAPALRARGRCVRSLWEGRPGWPVSSCTQGQSFPACSACWGSTGDHVGWRRQQLLPVAQVTCSQAGVWEPWVPGWGSVVCITLISPAPGSLADMQ